MGSNQSGGQSGSGYIVAGRSSARVQRLHQPISGGWGSGRWGRARKYHSNLRGCIGCGGMYHSLILSIFTCSVFTVENLS